jgi:hypothetical protein
MAYRRALLGRGTVDAEGLSVFRQRLGPRRYHTSLGPGGVSAELIALGHAEAPELVRDPELLDPPDVTEDLTTTAEPGEPTGRLALVELVEALVDRAPELERVQDVAARLAARCLAPARAVAAAVLVPDGVAWRVEGGAGLTAAERRVVLGIGHRLVAGVAPGGRYLSVDGMDPVREHLAGAPLAGRQHVIAVPVPPTQAIVVLARDEGAPFGGADVGALAAELVLAASELRTAMRARILARLLDPLRLSDGRG